MTNHFTLVHLLLHKSYGSVKDSKVGRQTSRQTDKDVCMHCSCVAAADLNTLAAAVLNNLLDSCGMPGGLRLCLAYDRFVVGTEVHQFCPAPPRHAISTN